MGFLLSMVGWWKETLARGLEVDGEADLEVSWGLCSSSSGIDSIMSRDSMLKDSQTSGSMTLQNICTDDV
eukprot:scaffold64529_cov28-Prasinocladus_malaysianus.AAC.1